MMSKLKPHTMIRILILTCLLLLQPGKNISAKAAGGDPSHGSSKLSHSVSEQNVSQRENAIVAGTPIGLHVNGKSILEANGSTLVMRGINHPHTWFPGQTSSFSNIKAKGANAIRVVLSSGDYPSWTKNSASDVANVINLCKANRLICVLEVHDTTGYGQQTGAASLSQAVNYWKEIKSALMEQEAYVIINIGNEPYGSNNVVNWVSATKNAILEMRNAGFQHMLMVDAPDWGQDTQFIMRDYAAEVFASDPNHNLVFGIHMYETFNTKTKIETYITSFVNANLPLVINEFGYLSAYGDPDEDNIMALARTYGIGYFVWSWSGNGDPVKYLDMVTNFDPNQMTWWGNRTINGPDGIVETSHEASIYDCDTVGVFRPSNGLLYLKKSNVTGFADIAINYGIGGDYPVTGDWNGDGIDTIGVYRNGVFYLRNSNTIGYADLYFSFGSPGDQPIAGDWNGDGTDTVGVYRSSNFTFYLRDTNTAGPPDYVFRLGIPGDIGIAGDWTKKGYDSVGVFRPSNGVIFLKNTNSTGYADIAINYGIAGDKPVIGDWNNDGIDTIGILRGNTFYLRNSNTVGYADMYFALGIPGDMPIAGKWVRP